MEIGNLDEREVRTAYARWAPVYDLTFGLVSHWVRKEAVKQINEQCSGKVLEIGVGTGLALPFYGDHLEVTGIDMSVDMLKKARRRVESENLDNIAGIHEMDASNLTFPDGYFDTVVAMFVMPVVPDPLAVMSELNRVCADGGRVLLLNHFYDGHGVRGGLEKFLAKYAGTIGWHSDFPTSSVMTEKSLVLKDAKIVGPFNLFTMLKFDKEPVSAKVGMQIAAAE